MSDPTSAVDSSVDPTTSEVELEIEAEPSRVNFTPIAALQVCTSAYMFALGGYFYYKYPRMVNTNDLLFDRWDEDPIVTQLDKTWALNTKEIKRWT